MRGGGQEWLEKGGGRVMTSVHVAGGGLIALVQSAALRLLPKFKPDGSSNPHAATEWLPPASGEIAVRIGRLAATLSAKVFQVLLSHVSSLPAPLEASYSRSVISDGFPAVHDVCQLGNPAFLKEGGKAGGSRGFRRPWIAVFFQTGKSRLRLQLRPRETTEKSQVTTRPWTLSKKLRQTYSLDLSKDKVLQ